ncbi:class I SAM-dependent methyltransferase [Tenacibaculum sp. SG-28]|uniref:class I SAM-dependent methyltransferase n=1 Tax=Tenacibaculum sp. SG-28 TaxID=754426 RepID=UPI000CF3A93D|nr:class I SAM-dependent methyltransferase [Tenacibaculum sp. SG-28]PQJ23177.1 polyketide synthase [Tenacibaculum sp. SG-28]
MLSKEEKTTQRGILFRHLDGIVTVPTAFVLWQQGVTEYLLKNKKSTLHELCNYFNANEGYLNVGLRVLASQGWIKQTIDNQKNSVQFEITAKSPIAFSYFQYYKEANNVLQSLENFSIKNIRTEALVKIEKLYANYQLFHEKLDEKKGIEKEILAQVLSHMEGIILGPIAVLLGMSGLFHKYFMETKFEAEEFHKDPKTFSRILNLLSNLGWFVKNNQAYEFTDKGLFYARRAAAYGVTVSYIPMLAKLEQLLFKNASIMERKSLNNEEVHVNRAMNVWGSGGAHNAYFKIVDSIIIALFNRPIHEQPKGVIDVGCGNGAFLTHIFNVIENQTERGKILEEYPLFLIGVDYNTTAIKITKENLIKADIWAKVIWGDIGNPEQLAKDLYEKYTINLSDLLNVRTFLDHNRMWTEPNPEVNKNTVASTGAFAFKGKRLPNIKVIHSLKQHFKKWLPYVEKYGLLLIELHTLPPTLVAKNIGKTAATAYDATHGYSDQYIVELDTYMHIMRKIGLIPDEKTFHKFPNSELATVSINLFTTSK